MVVLANFDVGFALGMSLSYCLSTFGLHWVKSSIHLDDEWLLLDNLKSRDLVFYHLFEPI